LLGYIYGIVGKRLEAERVLKQLQELPVNRPFLATSMAAVYTGLGDKDQAFHWLHEGWRNRDSWIIFLKVDPQWESLRSDPRFDQMLERLDLVDKRAARDQGIHSVAVLPFENVGGDPKTEFLSDGVADQIINSLSQVRRKDLKVRPFTSVARYKGQKPDVPTFGRELHVDAIVTGKLHQQSDDLTINVALVDVRDESQFWGDTYHAKLSTILDLQDRIAREVAAHLRLQLSGEEDKRLTKRYTEDPEAYLLFREAIYHHNKLTEDGLRTAIEYCERALKKDTNYALARAVMGRCYVALGSIHQGPLRTYPEARKHLDMALKRDDTLGDAHSALGVIHMFHDWDWPSAEREVKRAIDLQASVPPWGPVTYYGFYLAAMDRLPEALASTRRGQERDPLAPAPWMQVAQCHNWMGQYDEAIAEAKKALELDPGYFLARAELGLAYTQKGMPQEAIVELMGLDLGKGHPWNRGVLGYAHAKAGQTVEARRVLEELKKLAESRYGCAFPIVRIHAGLGEKDEAFKWLQKACDERDPHVIWIKIDPTLENLRSDPRFAEILKEMRLPP
jgi:TolB-like protein/Tfp pilus assembly protein PilF